jgi:hypothetical protein
MHGCTACALRIVLFSMMMKMLMSESAVERCLRDFDAEIIGVGGMFLHNSMDAVILYRSDSVDDILAK